MKKEKKIIEKIKIEDKKTESNKTETKKEKKGKFWKDILVILNGHMTKHKRKIRNTILTIVTLVLLLVIALTLLNVRFSIKEDLEITIDSRHITMDITKNDPAQINIPVKIETIRLCKVRCTETLLDVNSNKTISTKDMEFRQSHKTVYSRTIYPSSLGEGQDIYLYSISCNNIITKMCPAGVENIENDVIITLNRQLTNSEKSIKLEQEKILQNIHDELNVGKSAIDESSQIFSQLKYVKKNDLQKNISSLTEQKDRLNNSLLRVEKVWITRDHLATNEIINNEDIKNLGVEFNSSSNELLDELDSRIINHNIVVDTSYYLNDEINNSKTALNDGKQFLRDNFSNLNNNLKDSTAQLSFVTTSIDKKNFLKYSDLLSVLSNINDSIENFKIEYIKSLSNNTQIVRADIDLFLTAEDNCIISNYSPDCKTDLNINLFDFEQNNYNNTRAKTHELCASYSSLVDNKQILQNRAIQKRNNLSKEFLTNVDLEALRYRLYLLKMHKDQLSSRTDSSSIIATNILDEYIFLLENIPINNTGNNSSPPLNAPASINNSINPPTSFNTSLFEYFLPETFTLKQMTKCDILLATNAPLNLSYEETPTVNVTMHKDSYPELSPLCCFKNNCVPCINDSTKNYPLILIHGHGFYSKNYPTIPPQMYNGLQQKLLDEQLYIPAGIIREEDPIVVGSLGLINAPFTYKASYYPQDFLNNESISVFANRLNVIIKNAKKETGKDKVIIIAHSMGGLVTREYLVKYGTSDIDKIIIVGTPNNGITSETVTFCKLFGRDLECDEMNEKSEFIKTLHNESIPNIPVYTIQGVGCSTFGADGDGIVQAQSVLLDYAPNYKFNGTCSFTGAFHINLLNPAENPQIYSKVKELLGK